MNSLEIKKQEDKLTVGRILLENGYTVRIATVKEGNKPKIVLMYEKQSKEKLS